MTSEAKRDSMDATVSDVKTKLEDTHLNPSTPRKGRLGLTDLPPSVRNRIYAHVLDTELVNVGKPNVSYTHSIKDGVLQFKASRPPFPVETALFYVNKEISKEALVYFYSKNLFVKFEVYSGDARHAKTMLEDSGLLFSVAEPEKVDNCKRHALDLTILEKNSAQKRAVVMYPAQYLPRLINFMDQASRASGTWAPTHALFMTVLNTYDLEIARLQGDVLELFRLLTNVGAVTIDKTNLLPGYAEGLQTSMTAATFDPDAWLSNLSETIDRAVSFREKKDYATSTQLSQSAIISMTYAFLTRAETLHSQPEAFQKSIQRLRWRTELGLGTTVYTKHASLTADSTWLTNSSTSPAIRQTAAKDLLAAETATSQALSIATDSPEPRSNPWFRSLPPELIPPNKPDWFTEQEKGMSWYACGLVHNALGEFLFAAGDLERAQDMWKDGEGVKEAFDRAREGIDWQVRPGTGLKRAMRAAKG